MLDGVKLWGTSRKTVDMQTRMIGNKRLNFLPFVNRRVIPDQHHRAVDTLQQIAQEIDHLLACQIALVHLRPQLDPLSFGCYQQRADQVRSLLMLQAGANCRRLTARCPSALERTNQRLATFIEENKGCAQGLPLFLSTASDNVSNGR